MKIKSFIGGYDKNFSYLIWCEKSKEAAIIDPAINPSFILNTIKINGLKLTKILITHTHYDHIAFTNHWIRIYDKIKIYGYDVSIINHDNKNNVIDKQSINLGNINLKSIYTPGHYPDSVCYLSNNDHCIFTGDTMFVGRTGRTISQGSNISDLYQSIYNVLLKLPKSTIIYPGHDYGITKNITINDSIKNYNFFKCKSENEFIQIMNNFEKNRLIN